MSALPSVAFVVQRCGEDVVGGAESLCLQVAERMSERFRVEILTTCARDYATWRNHYPAGHARVRGAHLVRFPVDAPRNPAAFDARSRRLRERLKTASLAEQEEWMRAQGPVSSALAAYLQAHQRRFSTIGFFGYLYATSYLLLPTVAEKAVLWPFAHDEWPLHLSMWDAFFARPRRLVTSSVEESALLARRFPELTVPRELVSVGVAQPPGADAERFRERYGINGPFMLYLGRVDPSKGCDTLLDYARKYCGADARVRSLVLVGDTHMPIPEDPRILSLGRVEESVKWDALAAAQAVVMPSAYESLSLTVLEAWACGKPVLVNGASPVLVGQCRRAGGGVWYAAYDEFAAALDLLAGELGQRLGRQGRAHVERHYLWDEATAAYGEMLLS